MPGVDGMTARRNAAIPTTITKRTKLKIDILATRSSLNTFLSNALCQPLVIAHDFALYAATTNRMSTTVHNHLFADMPNVQIVSEIFTRRSLTILQGAHCSADTPSGNYCHATSPHCLNEIAQRLIMKAHNRSVVGQQGRHPWQDATAMWRIFMIARLVF